MIETVVLFILALGAIFLAQLAESKPWARWMLQLMFLLLGGALLVFGVIMALTPAQWEAVADAPHIVGLGWMLIAIGLMIVAPAGIAAIATLRGLDPTWRGIPWTRPTHLAAWTLLAAFIGSNFAVVALKNLSELELAHPLTLILIQNVAFTLAALLGVGWGVRRNWREVARRLGLRRPALRDVFVGAGMSLIMLLSTAIVGGLTALVFGVDLKSSSDFNAQILAQLPGAWGILLMGLATGVGEELLFRGALQPVTGLWPASLLFAISHIQYLSPAILVIFVLGALLGWTRNRWGLNTAIWSHAMYNSLVGLFALLAMNIDQLTPGV